MLHQSPQATKELAVQASFGHEAQGAEIVLVWERHSNLQRRDGKVPAFGIHAEARMWQKRPENFEDVVLKTMINIYNL